MNHVEDTIRKPGLSCDREVSGGLVTLDDALLASFSNSAASSCECGLFSDVFKMTVFPAASAGTTVIVTRPTGAFHGAMMKLRGNPTVRSPFRTK